MHQTKLSFSPRPTMQSAFLSPGPGLYNLVNTCYINSCIQILFHTREFAALFDDGTYKSQLNPLPEAMLLEEWDNLRRVMARSDTRPTTVIPTKFVDTMKRVAQHTKMTLFTGSQQNDVAEFLVFMFDSFHKALAKPVRIEILGEAVTPKDELAVQCLQAYRDHYATNYSSIVKYFYGVMVTRLRRSDTGEMLSTRANPFFMLDLPIPDAIGEPTLDDCFQNYICSQVQDYKDETTHEPIPVSQHVSFWSLPDVLIIDMKRYTNSDKKNAKCVRFPIVDLDLSAYVEGYHASSYVYDLYAVSNHTGRTSGGHCTSYVLKESGEWVHCNDTAVVGIPFAELETRLVTSNAYILFYRKRSSP